MVDDLEFLLFCTKLREYRVESVRVFEGNFSGNTHVKISLGKPHPEVYSILANVFSDLGQARYFTLYQESDKEERGIIRFTSYPPGFYEFEY